MAKPDTNQLTLSETTSPSPVASPQPSSLTQTSAMPDWVRLQKALSVESERGFNNIEGHQQLFSEFLSNSLHKGKESLSEHLSGQISSDKWQTLAERFDSYSDLSFSQRQHLVADTRRFLHRARQVAEALPLLAENSSHYNSRTKPKKESKK